MHFYYRVATRDWLRSFSCRAPSRYPGMTHNVMQLPWNYKTYRRLDRLGYGREAYRLGPVTSVMASIIAAPIDLIVRLRKAYRDIHNG